MPTEIPPATVADVLGTATATPEPAPAPDRSAVPPVEPAQPAAPVDCDAKGVPFDPERHLPVKHPRTGCWMPRRKPAAGTPPPKAPASSPTAAAAPDAPPPDLSDIDRAAKGPEAAAKPAGPSRFTMLADVYCRGSIALACTAISDEWRPDSDAEYLALRDTIAAWFEAEGWDKLSPRGAALAAIGGYVASRAVRPKTLTKFAMWRAGIIAWWKGRSVARQVAAMPTPGGAA